MLKEFYKKNGLFKTLLEIPDMIMKRFFRKSIKAKESYVPLEAADTDSASAKKYKELMNNNRGYFYGKDLKLVADPKSDEDYRSNIEVIERYEDDMKFFYAFDRIAYIVFFIAWCVFLFFLSMLIVIKAYFLFRILWALCFNFFMEVLPHGHYSIFTFNKLDRFWGYFTSPVLLELLKKIFHRS